MKKLIVFLCLICMTLVLSGCGNTDSGSKTYYCESEEHELRGKTCVIKHKNYKPFETCQGGYKENGFCITESTYDALEK